VRIRLSTSLKNSSTDIPQSQMLIERRWWRSNRAHASFMYYSANRRAVASKRFDRLGFRQTFAVTREDLGFNARAWFSAQKMHFEMRRNAQVSGLSETLAKLHYQVKYLRRILSSHYLSFNDALWKKLLLE